MEWTVWVIKVYGITTGSWITVLREGKETFPSRSSQRFKISVSWDCAVVFCCAAHFPNGRWGFACETSSYAVSESNTKHRNGFGQRRGGILHINWQEDEQQPCPPSPISKPASPDSYTASRRTWKWTKKLFFHLLDLTIVNSHILLYSCGGNFRLTLIREMLARVGHEPRPSMPVGRPAPASTNIGRLDTTHNKHWPTRNHTKARCRVCSARGVRREVVFKCVKCDVALCADRNCFEDYHTKTNVWDIVSIILRTNRWSLDHNVSKRTCIFTSLFRNSSSPLRNKEHIEFLRHSD